MHRFGSEQRRGWGNGQHQTDAVRRLQLGGLRFARFVSLFFLLSSVYLSATTPTVKASLCVDVSFYCHTDSPRYRHVAATRPCILQSAACRHRQRHQRIWLCASTVRYTAYNRHRCMHRQRNGDAVAWRCASHQFSVRLTLTETTVSVPAAAFGLPVSGSVSFPSTLRHRV